MLLVSIAGICNANEGAKGAAIEKAASATTPASGASSALNAKSGSLSQGREWKKAGREK